MTPDDLSQHYWTAGSSSKNNEDARAAGVVGTFGIGAMANFASLNHPNVVFDLKPGMTCELKFLYFLFMARGACFHAHKFCAFHVLSQQLIIFTGI